MYFQKGQEEENPTGRGLQLGPFPEMEWTNAQVRVVNLVTRNKRGKEIVSGLLLHSFANFSHQCFPRLKSTCSELKKYLCECFNNCQNAVAHKKPQIHTDQTENNLASPDF